MSGTALTTSDEDCGCDGEAVATGTGSTAPYTYEWFDATMTPIGQTTAIATNLCPGDYFVTITSFTGCAVIESITIEPESVSFDIISVAQNGANCQVTMQYCSETGGSAGNGLDNTGAFGFVLFGSSQTSFDNTITSNSNGEQYDGTDYWTNPLVPGAVQGLFGLNAQGFIGYSDPDWSPLPPNSLPDWFLCNDDPACGPQGLVCNTTMIEFPSASMPDSIMLVGIEGNYNSLTKEITIL
jgi:hypothetical protein